MMQASSPNDGLRSALLCFALGALLVKSWKSLRDVHRRRLSHRSPAPPQRLQTWEGEGGRPDAATDTGA